MRVMAVFGIRLRQEIRFYAAIERTPIATGVLRLEHPSTGHADIHVRRISRIDLNGVELRTVRCAVLVAAAPCLALRMRIESFHSPPRSAVIVGHEKTLRRRPRVPDAGVRRMSGGQPECVIDDALAALLKCRRLFCFMPRSAAIAGAKNRGPEVSGARRRQDRASVARIRDTMMNDVPEKLRSRKVPGPARRVAMELPQSLARSDKQGDKTAPCGLELRHVVLRDFVVQRNYAFSRNSTRSSREVACRAIARPMKPFDFRYN